MFNLQDFSLHHSSVVSQEEDSHRDLIRKKIREGVGVTGQLCGRKAKDRRRQCKLKFIK